MKTVYFSKFVNKRKNYIVPAMEIVTMEHQMDLLECSDCEPPNEDAPRAFGILEDD